MDVEVIIVIIVLVTIVLIWRAIINYVTKKLHLVGEITEHTGPKMSSSGWRGRADINGMYFKNGVKVIHYEQGYVIKLSPVWGGGKLWLPKKGLVITGLKTDTIFDFNKSASLKSGANTILLTGYLVDQIVSE